MRSRLKGLLLEMWRNGVDLKAKKYLLHREKTGMVE